MRHSLMTMLAGLLVVTMMAACGDDQGGPTTPDPTTPDPTTPDPTSPDPTTPDPTTPSGGDEAIVSQTSAISECGGFGNSRAAKPQGTFGATDYCAAEVLDWSYDPASGTLKLSNNRVPLNCCGDHTITVSKQGDTFVIKEVDAPEGGTGRCHCMCVFDFTTEVKLASSVTGKIKIKIVREVTDSGDGEQEIYAGSIDLSTAAGTEIVDASEVVMGCESSQPEPEQPVDEVEHTFAVSECGGFEPASYNSASNSDYCDAEVLQWSYDALSKQLTLSNNRVLLNCCGDHSVEVTKSIDGTYSIIETDAPEAGGGRCNCMCVFDFTTTIDNVSGNTVAVQLTRQVQDTGKASVSQLFDGSIDLTQSEGVVVIDPTDVAPWCEAS